MDLYFKPVTRATTRKQMAIMPHKKDSNILVIDQENYDKKTIISAIPSFLYTSMQKKKDSKGDDITYDKNDYLKQLNQSLDNKKPVYLLSNQYEMRDFLKVISKGKIFNETETTKKEK